jgi:phage terminase large subunit-like protein
MDDPIDQVNRYISGVMDGSIVVGELVRKCVKRHLYDLENAGERGHYFDAKKAAAAVSWFPVCLQHVEGEWAGEPVTLTDNQAFIVWSIFGWRRSDGTRRFRHAYISCARKWGKSTIAAGLALQCLTADDPFEPAAQVYCAATKEDQAKIVHRLAQVMAENSEVMQAQVKVLARSITTRSDSFQPNSYFKPLGSDSRTADGFNLHCAVIDEVHEWREHHQGLWDKLNTASGSRRNWLVVTITTAGDDKSDLWISIEQLCQATLDNYTDDDPPGDNRFVFIARLDGKRACDCEALPDCQLCGGTGEIPEDDIFDEANWPKANPNFPITPKLDFLREQASDAKTNAKSLHAFKRYHCNIKVSSLSKAIDDTIWARAKGEFADWRDADAICGAWDMGGQDDMAAMGLCARFDTGQVEIDERTGSPTGRPVYRYEVDAVGFINRQAERDLSKEPFAQWVNQDLLRVNTMEINEMRMEVIREYRDNMVRSWAYDPHTSRDFAQSLEPEGIECVKFYQNANTWTEPLTGFLRDLKRGRIRHDGNGLLTWAVSNLITVQMSRKASVQLMPDKGESVDKIDPIVAVIMAYRLVSVAPARSRGRLFIS